MQDRIYETAMHDVDMKQSVINKVLKARGVFVPRDDILNISFVEHEHYFFACLTVCLRNFINVTEISKITLFVPQITISCFTSAKLHKNWLSFVEDITKTILVLFMGHSVVTYNRYNITSGK